MNNFKQMRLFSFGLFLAAVFLAPLQGYSCCGTDIGFTGRLKQEKQKKGRAERPVEKTKDVVIIVDSVSLQKNYEIESVKKNEEVRLTPLYLEEVAKALKAKKKPKHNVTTMNGNGIVSTGIRSKFNFTPGIDVMVGPAQFNKQRLDGVYKQIGIKPTTKLPVSISLTLKFVSVDGGVVRFKADVSIGYGRGGYVSGFPEIWEYDTSAKKFRLVRPASAYSTVSG